MHADAPRFHRRASAVSISGVTSQTTTLDNCLTTSVDTTYATDGTSNVHEFVEYGFSGSPRPNPSGKKVPEFRLERTPCNSEPASAVRIGLTVRISAAIAPAFVICVCACTRMMFQDWLAIRSFGGSGR